MAKRKAAPRRSNKRQKSSSGMVTWLGLLALSVGAIWVYENRPSYFFQKTQVASAKVQKPSAVRLPADVPVPAKAPSSQRAVAQVTRDAPAKNTTGPIPPRSIPQTSRPDAVAAVITAALPGDRPIDSTSTPLIKVQQPSDPAETVSTKQQFSFCGRSGLKNCVEDGRIFWRDGKKQVLAGIIVPRTDEAACVEERRKGFAAKIRLRDFLNHGDYRQSSGASGLSVSRNGLRFEEQLLREGLAMPANQKNQSWCG